MLYFYARQHQPALDVSLKAPHTWESNPAHPGIFETHMLAAVSVSVSVIANVSVSANVSASVS